MIENYLDTLKKDFAAKKQMALFLGAGVNDSPGKGLLWSNILSSFLDNALPLLDMSKEEISLIKKAFYPSSDNQKMQLKGNMEFSTEMKVSVIKSLLGNAYIPLLQDILYSQCNHKVLEIACKEYVGGKASKDSPFHSLFSIAEMIIKNDNIKAVITYNYDNFLNEAITLLQNEELYFGFEACGNKWFRQNTENFHPIDIYSGWGEESFTNFSFPIYHIHGYIQPPDSLKPNPRNKVVMSLDEFYENAEDVNAWHKAVQLNYLTHYTCLYMGASLSDMTMHRILNAAKIQNSSENVYYLTKKETESEYIVLKKLKNKFHAANNLKVIEVEDYYNFYQDINNKI